MRERYEASLAPTCDQLGVMQLGFGAEYVSVIPLSDSLLFSTLS